MHPRQEQIFTTILQQHVDQRLPKSRPEIKTVAFREFRRIRNAPKAKCLEARSQSQGVRWRTEQGDERHSDRYGAIPALGAMDQYARAALQVMCKEYEPDRHPSFELGFIPLPLLDRQLDVIPSSRSGMRA